MGEGALTRISRIFELQINIAGEMFGANMKSKVIWIVMAVVVVVLAAGFIIPLFANPSEPLPDALQEELIHATNFEALALNHVPVKFLNTDGASIGTNQMMNYVILGGAQITNASLQQELVGAVCHDIKYANHSPSDCLLEPRHGIRCQDGTNIIMIAICYHCGDVAVEWNGSERDYLIKKGLQLPASRRIFERIFHDAGVKEDEN